MTTRTRLPWITASITPGDASAEGGVEVERLRFVGNAEARLQFVERALLGDGDAALAQHEAADVSFGQIASHLHFVVMLA